MFLLSFFFLSENIFICVTCCQREILKFELGLSYENRLLMALFGTILYYLLSVCIVVLFVELDTTDQF